MSPFVSEMENEMSMLYVVATTELGLDVVR
jgi:hypothetical protein